MQLCNYGCGREAKYQFKNGKWCCSENFRSCPFQRKKISTKIKEIHKDPNSKYNLPECKEKQSNTMKEIWKDPNSKLNSPEWKKKQSKSKEEMWKDPNSKYNSPEYKGGKRKGSKDSEETKKRKSKSKKGLQINEKNPIWKGGYNKRNIPRYDHFEKKLYLIEKIRRNKIDRNILEVKCAYCGKWCTPKETEVHERIRSVETFGDTRLYCSNECKQACPIYNQKKYPKGFKLDNTSREVQPELRQMRFKFDGYICQKCKKHQDELDVPLNCHHIEGIRWEPLESADLDKVITVCEDCHKKIHQIEGCGYNDMKCPD